MSFHEKTGFVVGLTGSMLSGKSTALAYFKAQGAGVISCDEIVRTLYTRPAVLAQVKKRLGTADKTQLAQIVFKNKAKRTALEKLVHPLILKEVKAQLKVLTQPLVVVETPLLFEAGWEQYMDLTVAVLADPKTLPARLKGRHITRAEFTRRTAHQLPDLQKAARADVVFFHATKAQLKQSVTRFCHAFNLLHTVK